MGIKSVVGSVVPVTEDSNVTHHAKIAHKPAGNELIIGSAEFGGHGHRAILCMIPSAGATCTSTSSRRSVE